jgi:hypothetical protein
MTITLSERLPTKAVGRMKDEKGNLDSSDCSTEIAPSFILPKSWAKKGFSLAAIRANYTMNPKLDRCPCC